MLKVNTPFLLLKEAENFLSLAHNLTAIEMGTVYAKSVYTVPLTTRAGKISIIGSQSNCHSNGNGVC